MRSFVVLAMVACTPDPDGTDGSAGAPVDPVPDATGVEPSPTPSGPPVHYELDDDEVLIDNGILRARTDEGGVTWFEVFHPTEEVWYTYRNNLTIVTFAKNGEKGRGGMPSVEPIRDHDDAVTLRYEWAFENKVEISVDVTMRRGEPEVEFVLTPGEDSAPMREYQWQISFGQAEAVQELAFGDRAVDVSGYEGTLPGGAGEPQLVEWYGGWLDPLRDRDFVFWGQATEAPDPNNPPFLDRVLGLVQHVRWEPALESDRLATETRDRPWSDAWGIPQVAPWIDALWFDRNDDFPEQDTLVYRIDDLGW